MHGCSDLRAPLGAWIKRDGDVMVGGCKAEERRWEVWCNGKEWVGEVGECGMLEDVVQENENSHMQGFVVVFKNLQFIFCTVLHLKVPSYRQAHMLASTFFIPQMSLSYLSIHSFIHLFIHSFIYPSIYPTIHPFIQISIHPFIYLTNQTIYSCHRPFIHFHFIIIIIYPCINSSIHLISSGVYFYFFLSLFRNIFYMN